MVVVDALHGDSAAAAADELFGGGTGYADLQAFFDHTVPEVKASGCGSDGEEELEWLSNKDAFPAVETMDSAGARPRTKQGARQSRAGAAERRECRHCGAQSTPQWREGPMGRRTLCNACGIKYRAGLLLPEYRPAKSPTFSPALHSNHHQRIAELRRRREEAVETSLAAAVTCGEGGQELERRPNKSAFLGVKTVAPAGQRPRTKGLQRPRRVLAWSPPPPRTPAQGRVPGAGSAGAGGGGGGAADEGRAAAAAPSGGGSVDHAVRAAALQTPAPAVAQRCCLHCGMGNTSQWRKGPDGKPSLCNACGLCYRKSGGLVPEYRPASSPTFSPKLHSSSRRFIQRRLRASPVIINIDASADQERQRLAVAQRCCQHCGMEDTPSWRRGPDGKRSLCNACGQRWSGALSAGRRAA